MKTSLASLIIIFRIAMAFGQEVDPYDYVDPLIGTSYATTESALKHGSGTEGNAQTFPCVGMPYAMTNWTPQTRPLETKCISPYYYHDTSFQGFRGSHFLSGSCVQDYGSFTIMPVPDIKKLEAVERGCYLDHNQENAEPAYYSIDLMEQGIKAEMTGSTRCGMFRFTYQDKNGWVVIEPNSDEGEGFIKIDLEKGEVYGYNPVHRIYQGWGEPAGFSGYFVLKFNSPIKKSGVWRGNKRQAGKEEVHGKGKHIGAFLKFADQVVVVKASISFTSFENARKNLEEEIPEWDFDEIHLQAKEAWGSELDQVKVTGGTSKMKEVFYTAFFHTKLLPRIFSDVDGSYPGFAEDNLVYKAVGYDYYADYTAWDSFRAVHPLITILDPERGLDMVKSLIDKAEQGGWLPIFPCWNNYTAGMIGDHTSSIIVDAYMKGIDAFDNEKAYHYMRKNAFESPLDRQTYLDGKGRRGLDSYLKYGYIPLEDPVREAFHKKEQVSRTLEYAYDDFVLGLMAKKLGHEKDFEILMDRSGNYANVFDRETGFVRGKHQDGRWAESFSPYGKSEFITEGSAFQYTWFVPHDPSGLIELFGGDRPFKDRLDSLFDSGEYWHGNEPGHHTAYLYPYGGFPWKTQQRIRKILDEEYGTGPGGLTGNEDVGQMSAWAVFSMMGLYPVSPGIPYYILGTPIFDEIEIQPKNSDKSFRIRAPRNDISEIFIHKVKLNSLMYNKSYIWHSDIMKGGILEIVPGQEPNKEFGKNVNERPPSRSDRLELILEN